MGNRLSKIYTRTGDKGDTGLGDGSRVGKDHLRVEAYGTVDELNSVLGLLLAGEVPDNIRTPLTRVQHRLFDLGGELSVPGYKAIPDNASEELEATLDELNADLPALKEFILPGGSQAAATAHLARTVCRRAERRLVALMKAEDINEAGVRYLNRLSDLLFVVARSLNRHAGIADVLWENPNRKD